jgi:hypothetical protein
MKLIKKFVILVDAKTMAEKQKKTVLTVKQKSSEMENFRMEDLQQNQLNRRNRNTKHMT